MVVFGLTVSSSWGNGHATLWRGLCKALATRGHHVTFFEKDVSYYRDERDLTELPGGGTLRFYSDFAEIRAEALRALNSADIAMTTSFCPDGVAAADLMLQSNAGLTIFYDLDTPVTLDALRSGKPVPYLPPQGLSSFDLVLSYTGGRALDELRSGLGAVRVAPLYGWVDPEAHRPVPAVAEYAADLSYLGTYAADRQPAVERLFVEPARHRPDARFLIGGAQYPDDFPWTPNIFFARHVPPPTHPAFFSSSRWTLNVTRRAMAEYGFCPSGRLFEAAACGCPIVSDGWNGLDTFFTPDEEIVLARSSAEVEAALDMPEHDRLRMARCARERVLAEHTAAARVDYLENLVNALPQMRLPEAV